MVCSTCIYIPGSAYRSVQSKLILFAQKQVLTSQKERSRSHRSRSCEREHRLILVCCHGKHCKLSCPNHVEPPPPPVTWYTEETSVVHTPVCSFVSSGEGWCTGASLFHPQIPDAFSQVVRNRAELTSHTKLTPDHILLIIDQGKFLKKIKSGTGNRSLACKRQPPMWLINLNLFL